MADKAKRIFLLMISAVCLFLLWLVGWQLPEFYMRQNKLSTISIPGHRSVRKHRYILNKTHSILQYDTGEPEPPSKTILFWTTYYSYRKLWPFDKKFPLGPLCPYRCRLTHKKSLYNQSDAVLFHAWTVDIDKLPKWRFPYQQWVLYNQEPPFRLEGAHFHAADYNGLFNWTMSYKTNSDVYSPYGRRGRISGNEKEPTQPRTKFDRKPAAVALIRRCSSTQGRVQFAYELAEHYPVHFYGRCFGQTICQDMPRADASRYYLAFENSVGCSDYITEKYWVNGLRSGSLPVVMGTSRTDYERLAIPGSYIHVNDFKSAEALAAHLRNLDAHADAYSAYFSWVNKYKYSRNQKWCELCSQLHEQRSGATQVYDSLEQWLGDCRAN
ncbi:PREDICTED: alpha-(1,3)-fucosyltransferase 7-like isoform X2 [Priapulus caudatus]|uniref:Fucosyltransferase n=1 Tax=Priapulus caudatus TaxID=37621 RepID=A0ABM1E6Z4_PRICU|nr:PREDICTED: alpha-(1,3)-fucosyltransferase 7-like isoform X2 [Priapulus caudatus]